jgi:hypothetical protein
MNIDEEAKALRREYYRQWREKPESKEKVRKYSQRYWLKKAQRNLRSTAREDVDEQE